MKKCPQCKTVFSDDNLYCLNDGATLISTPENIGKQEDTPRILKNPPVLLQPSLFNKGVSPLLLRSIPTIFFVVSIFLIFYICYQFLVEINRSAHLANPNSYLMESITIKILGIEMSFNDAVTVAFSAMIVTAIGTLSTLIIAWRNERRSKIETDLRIQKLELEIANLKSADEDKKKIVISKV